MSEKITPKLFLHRASTAKNAIGFIQQYRRWLETGELASIVSPILRKIDEKVLFPTPGLTEITNAVLASHLAHEVQKQEILQAKKIAVANKPGITKNYMSSIFDCRGNEICDPAQHIHDTDGIRWCDRRLINEAPGSYGEVVNTAMTGRDGNFLVLVVHRDDAISRLLKAKKGPVVQRRSMGMSKPMGWQMRCKQDRQSFSRG